MEVYQLSKEGKSYIEPSEGDTNIILIKGSNIANGRNTSSITFGWHNSTYYNGCISSWNEHFFEPIKKEYIFIKNCNYIRGNISDLMIRPSLPNGGNYGDLYLSNTGYSLITFIKNNNIENLPFIGIFAEKNNTKANDIIYELNLVISGVGIVTLDIGLHSKTVCGSSYNKIYKGLKIKNNSNVIGSI